MELGLSPMELVAIMSTITERAVDLIKPIFKAVLDKANVNSWVYKWSLAVFAFTISWTLISVTGIDFISSPLGAADLAIDSPVVSDAINALLGAGGSGLLHAFLDFLRRLDPDRDAGLQE